MLSNFPTVIMEVNIDTKEKFHAISVATPNLSANMAASLYEQITPLLQSDNRNVVISFKDMKSLDEDAAEILVKMQQRFYDENASLVICQLTQEAEDYLEKIDLLEVMNITPTESEAWDIVQMEEIERELFDDSDKHSLEG